jgi:hypothetical protein
MERGGRVSKTKKVKCSSDACGDRRISWDRQDVPRGTRILEVPIDHPGPWYCSLTCQAHGNKTNVWTGKKHSR